MNIHIILLNKVIISFDFISLCPFSIRVKIQFSHLFTPSAIPELHRHPIGNTHKIYTFHGLLTFFSCKRYNELVNFHFYKSF